MTNGVNQRKMTTGGWQLCIQRKYGSTNWVAIKDIKQSCPVELSDYEKWMNIDYEPAFAWWFTYVERKRKNLLSKVNSKY